jgi:hypothetical protein
MRRPAGRWSVALDVATLRSLLRNLQAFRACYETEGIDTLTDPDGVEWTLWDLEYLYEQLPLLPIRQHQAIELCFVQNMKEAEAAVAMGVSFTNPVSIYANNGLTKLISMIQAGRFPRFRPDYEAGMEITIDVTVEPHLVDVTEEQPCRQFDEESTGHLKMKRTA